MSGIEPTNAPKLTTEAAPPPSNAREAAAAARKAATEARKAAAAREREERRLAAEVRQKESDDRFTPPELIEAVEESICEVDFDPCWHEASAVRPKAYLDVRRGDNGLRDAWSGRLALVNPPWSARERWIERAHDQWRRGNVEIVVFIGAAATSAPSFHGSLAEDAHIFFVEGRPRFYKEDGTSEPTMNNIMIVMFGTDARQRTRFAELVKGSWWQPEPPSPVVTGPVWIRPRGVAFEYAEGSCAARVDIGAARRLVDCTPLAAQA